MGHTCIINSLLVSVFSWMYSVHALRSSFGSGVNI